MKTEAIVHSLQDVAIVEIGEHKNNILFFAVYYVMLCKVIFYQFF